LAHGGNLVGRTLSHYRITAAIGEVGMGQVWRATDTKLDPDVAIKILPDGMSLKEMRPGVVELEAV